ncbi:hypothetical protein B7P43_G09365 [Cryptotermes secundus]|uniref:PiggyBac transposable element-derived protein domain-containing protein n=1 Tax=Cryptotermes secundus TaxID=105785 RepID=A0A2J7Q8N9_9NEOP|nr:hypothetical protein B7P43_G09365 [Cryptotermes secundus]
MTVPFFDAVGNEGSDEDDSANQEFVWEDMQNYRGQREHFTGSVGAQGPSKDLTEIVDVFKLFFDKELIETIVTETNRYAEQFIRGREPSVRSHSKAWKPVTEGEIYVVLGLFMLMGIVQKPTLQSYFTTEKVISTPGFTDIITQDRLELICKYLHFANNENISTFEGPKKLFKIYPVIFHLNKKFQELCLPNQDISLDESTTLWKGRLSFKQYLPLKAAKFGIKSYKLCDSTTGYLWSFILYTGKDTVLDSSLITADTNKTSAIDLKLVEPLLNQGQTLWMDNFYNSPTLARLLKITHKTDCVGTLKLNRKKLKKGEIVAQHSGLVSITKWFDKKIVTMISTYHSHDTRTVTVRGKVVEKPISVLDYNKSMGGVDLKDQLLHSYLIERKRMNKWYMKLFRRLLNASILNSMIVYRSNTGKRIQQLSFRIQLTEGLFVKYASAVEHKVPGSHPSDNTVPHLTERHFISKIPPTAKKSKRRDTLYWCDACGMGLCIECFRHYHTWLNF